MKTSALLLLFQLSVMSSFGQRKVLIEQFTNSGCPPCAGTTPIIASYVNSNANVLMLAYHTSFPYLDSMYHENPLQSDQRVAYYGLGAVPYSSVDGNYYAGPSPVLINTLNTTIANRQAIAPRYTIAINSTFSNGLLSGNAELVSLDAQNQNESLVMRIVVAEKNVLKNSYAASPGNNTETEYPWVVRKMLPDHSGTVLINKAVGGMDNIPFNLQPDNFKNYSEMRVIAFVQNEISKEVYQAEIAIPAGVADIAEREAGKLHIYPSVTTGILKIDFPALVSKGRLYVSDVNGKVVDVKVINGEMINLDYSRLNNGMYFIRLINESMQWSGKCIIKK